MVKGFDCATKLNKVSAKALKALGFEYAARYLGSSWKSFDKAEAATIQAAGLKLISIHQKSANYSAYFTEVQGISDAKEAMKNAAAVDQPKGTAIYFAVDFSSQAKDVKNIVKYFKAVKKTLSGYKLGVYGSYNTITAVKGIADYYWQTYAWSGGKVADFIHMHQFKNDVLAGGIKIDHNDVKKTPGHWAEEKVVSAPKTAVKAETTKVSTYDVVKTVNAYANAADAKAKKNKKATVAKGIYYVFNEANGMVNVTNKKGVPGSWINPAENKKSATKSATVKYHVVKKNETVTSIAKKEKTTVAAIKKLNSSIKNINLIYPGDKIRIR
ncbi:glycoside hydrolase domain-containing protein [Niallia sp. NCCP-28]|uniref:glycoside hydrolase domain-containing protein n=1 Tax=Niallia sp. NCCP-28 TaxID=2934712 RepID=UPI002085F735|nr:glycoside hydrolase domain-containing protein [Niallia sp. NCCP-28]GKU82579.1 hypothetical protein NCCP28_19750 [Niallia sp. NCCP-28]